MLFPTEVVLTITTGRLLCDMDKVYEILNYMTGDNLFTYQLPRVAKEMRPVLLEQHPQLEEVDASPVNKENWETYKEERVEQYGDSLEVLPIEDEGLHEMIGPIKEARDMFKEAHNGVGEDRVIPILIP